MQRPIWPTYLNVAIILVRRWISCVSIIKYSDMNISINLFHTHFLISVSCRFINVLWGITLI